MVSTPEGPRGAIPNDVAEQFKELAQYHSTNTATVKTLWSGGIKLDDLDTVLDIKDTLTIELNGNRKQEYTPSRQISADSVSTEALSRAYRAVNGDLDELESLAEGVIEEAGDERPYPGRYTELLNRFVDRIINREPLHREAVEELEEDL